MFSKDEVNIGRQNFLDVAKTLSIIFMIYVHVMLYCCLDYETLYPNFYLIVGFLIGGVWGAPVFMFCMGIGMVYARNKSFGSFAKRSFNLYLKAWLLNFLRAGLLLLTIYFITKNDFYYKFALISLTTIDILFFAALSFLAMAILRKLNFNHYTILFISILLSVFGSFIRNYETSSYFSATLLGYFIGTVMDGFESSFPFCNWFIFVASGYLFGHFLRHCTNVRRLLNNLFFPTLVVMIVYNIYTVPNLSGIYASSENFYQMTLIDAIYALASIIVLLNICYFLSLHLSPRLLNICSFMGRNLNSIYCIHWVVFLQYFMVIRVLLFKKSLNVFEMHLLTGVTVIGSVLLVKWYEKRCKSIRCN